MKENNAGFTLIELVIVITVIAILAAIALPKYIAVQTDARKAKMQALFGSVRTAAALGKARCELDLAATPVGPCSAGQVNMDGTPVDIDNRYPAATAAGIQTAASIDAASDGVVVTLGVGAITFTGSGATAPATCVISYTAAGVGGAPLISVSTGGC
ncbi:pilin [Rhodoferax sp.]|uniref:pilin n=1 Tax=Rhodoferax sp. TaxID=50421 RepID=UPI00274613BC|nr:prepilin-type N-terminal cleavage/methylation domain-containing protein [Rhodoferax sp.]